jgi:hypothetical protein
VVIAGGVLRASGPLEAVLGGPDGPVTRVRSAESGLLAALLRERGVFVEADRSGALLARGTPPAAVVRPERPVHLHPRRRRDRRRVATPDDHELPPRGARPAAFPRGEDTRVRRVHLLAPGLAALTMMAWIVAAFAAGHALLRRRDVR